MTEAVHEREASRKGLLRAAWRHRQFRYLLAGYAISSAGDFIYTVALVAYVYDQTGSPAWVSAAAVVRVIPYVLFGTLGGKVAARFDRQRVMIGSDVIRVAVMLAMAAAVASEAAAGVLLALAFVNTTVATPWTPAAVAVTPAVVGEDDLAAANAVEATVNQLAWFVGPALGAVLFAATGATVSFVVNGATFALSALMILRVPAARSRSKAKLGEHDADTDVPPSTSTWALLRETKGLVLLTALMMMVMLGYGFEVVLYPLVADERLGIGPEGAGYIIGAVGVGGLLVAPWSGRLAASRRSGAALAVAVVLLGLPLLLLSVVTAPAVAVALGVLEGFGNIGFEVLSITLLQRIVFGDDLARASGFQNAASCAAMLVGSLAAPVLVELLGLRAALVLPGVLLIAFGLVAAKGLSQLGTKVTAPPVELEPYLEVFRTLHIFDGAGTATLERIARAVVVEQRAAGDVVLYQGDLPDHFYVVRDGTLEVTVDTQPGVVLATVGAGNWVGEIGLLRGVPRTATVTAATDAVLWRIDGRTFGEAVAGIGETPSVLEFEMSRRLAHTMPARR